MYITELQCLEFCVILLVDTSSTSSSYY